MAYESDELGQFEIYVTAYPGPGPRCKVSTAGGQEPYWSAGGTELFYREPAGGHSTAMVARASDLESCATQPQRLFDGLDQSLWDVSPTADFFVTVAPRDPPRLNLYLNWVEELKRLVPVS